MLVESGALEQRTLYAGAPQQFTSWVAPRYVFDCIVLVLRALATQPATVLTSPPPLPANARLQIAKLASINKAQRCREKHCSIVEAPHRLALRKPLLQAAGLSLLSTARVIGIVLFGSRGRIEKEEAFKERVESRAPTAITCPLQPYEDSAYFSAYISAQSLSHKHKLAQKHTYTSAQAHAST